MNEVVCSIVNLFQPNKAAVSRGNSLHEVLTLSTYSFCTWESLQKTISPLVRRRGSRNV